MPDDFDDETPVEPTLAQIIRNNCKAVIRHSPGLKDRQLVKLLGLKAKDVRFLMASQRWTEEQGWQVAEAIGITAEQASNPDEKALLVELGLIEPTLVLVGQLPPLGREVNSVPLPETGSVV